MTQVKKVVGIRRQVKKRIPYMETVTLSLSGSIGAVDTEKITAENDRRIVIERISQDTRDASGAVVDANILVDISDRPNGSYTKGYAPLSAVGGKASVGAPNFLPMQLVIEPGGDLDTKCENQVATAYTVRVTYHGYEEVM